jgi:hypothetical protein
MEVGAERRWRHYRGWRSGAAAPTFPKLTKVVDQIVKTSSRVDEVVQARGDVAAAVTTAP